MAEERWLTDGIQKVESRTRAQEEEEVGKRISP